MSERILKALMQLFAILARVEFDEDDQLLDESIVGKEVVRQFLLAELSVSDVDEFYEYYMDQVHQLHKVSRKKRELHKRMSVNSVKVLRVCDQINKELSFFQKIVVLIRLYEYIRSNQSIQEQDLTFVSTVSEVFNILPLVQMRIQKLILYTDLCAKDSAFKEYHNNQAGHIASSENEGHFILYKVDAHGNLLARFTGTDEISVNGQNQTPDRVVVLSPGSTIKTAKGFTLYYTDALSLFIESQQSQKIVFKAEDLRYVFNDNRNGIQNLDLVAKSGTLFGIMGGSGTGKSTLINLLNGNIQPQQGRVTINGVDIHNKANEGNGIIGYVSQDDLLIEELSVYENLYYNAQLCFANMKRSEIRRKTLEMLANLGLLHVRDHKVGSPLQKSISGGQRKRLNIALELIREPSVLFIDEPTSGLSSQDSEKIINILKEITFRGKLVFVVIHQPSSDIFKMFDQMLVLDQGGYPVFTGNPVDAVVHFKQHSEHVNADQRECEVCGNVKPELIFSILESKVVDEFGNPTNIRKRNPSEWNELSPVSAIPEEETVGLKPLESQLSRPNVFKQWLVYLKRDAVAKSSNRQYLLITFLEAPGLALILSFFLKYYEISSENPNEISYSFFHNQNLPQYLFVAVIVALFLGLTVASEEIIKDRLLLKREKFLGLSRYSYIWSKIFTMFIISAIQTISFVWVGNGILNIKGVTWDFWLVLFSTACFANILGLIISSTFNSAKVIYIVVPLMIIPQLLFSGVIVKFDKLNPLFSSQKAVPWIGNAMVSRWAYESVVVSLKDHSMLNEKLYDWNQIKTESSWKRDFWITEMNELLQEIQNPKLDRDNKENALKIFNNEIKKENQLWSNLQCTTCYLTFRPKKQQIREAEDYINRLQKQYEIDFQIYSDSIDQYIHNFGDKEFAREQMKVSNDAINDLVSNRSELTNLVRYKGELVQKTNPYYQSPLNKSALEAPMYAHQKNWFGMHISTLTYNLMMIWWMNLVLYILLQFNVFAKIINRKPVAN